MRQQGVQCGQFGGLVRASVPQRIAQFTNGQFNFEQMPQRILARLAAAIPEAADHALACDDDQRQAFSPMLAILSSRHETQYSRLFRS